MNTLIRFAFLATTLAAAGAACAQDKVTSAGNLNTNGIFTYSNFSPFGFNGRQVYAKAAYRW